MDLRSFLSQFHTPYGKVRLADSRNSCDNQNLLEFFDQFSMSGTQLRLRYLRSPDFFSFLQDQSKEFFVFIYENPKGDILGVGTLSLRDAYLHGKQIPLGYLGDLRIKTDRKLAVVWRQFYASLLQKASQIQELRGCQHFITAVLDDNPIARNALIEKSSAKFKYIPLFHYEMVNLLSKFPWPSDSYSKFICRRATEEDRDVLWKFLSEQNKKTLFGFTDDEWNRRLKTWPDFDVTRFWICKKRRHLNSANFERAHSKQENPILGCFATWSPTPHKRILVEKLSLPTQLFFSTLRGLGAPKVKLGQVLPVTYLTHLYTLDSLSSEDRSSVFSALLHEYVQSDPHAKDSLISFCNFKNQPLLERFFPWITQKVPITLYQVIPNFKDISNEHLDLSRHPELMNVTPGFEIALV